MDACESHALYESTETSNTFLFVEEWASIDGLHAHFHIAHFAEFFGALGEVIAEAPTGTVSEASSVQTLDDAALKRGGAIS